MRWLIFASASAALGGFLFGLDAIVISGAIGPVRSQFAMTSAQEGLFVSASLIGCAVGASFAGPLADRFGRRPNLVAAGLITLLGVGACTLASTTSVLITTRFVGGLGVGIASMSCPLYIAEIAPQHLRGRLVSLYQFAITIGIVVALVCNAIIAANVATNTGIVAWSLAQLHREPWRVMFGMQVPAALAFSGLCLLVPESPRWLLWRGRRSQARAILKRFVAEPEVEATLVRFAAEAPAGTGVPLQALFNQYRRPALIAVFLAVFSELSGITVVFYYGPLLLESVGAGRGGALSGFAILGVVNMLSTLIALGLLDRAGRRKLLLIGSIGCAICMTALGALLGSDLRAPAAVITAICLFVAFYAFSLGPIKFVVGSEIFPRNLRGIGASLTTATVWATGAVINQLFPIVRDTIGPQAVFYFCAGSLLAHFFFVRFFLPETAGRSLEEIERYWDDRNAPPARSNHKSLRSK